MNFRVFTKKLKKRLIFTLIFLILAFSLIFAFIDGRLTPLMRTLATAYASRLLNDITSGAAAEYIKTSGVSTDELVTVKYSDGEVNALYIDTVAVNLLSCGISSLITSKLSESEKSFSVPLGNLFSSTLLAGRGPEISVKLIFPGTVSCEYESSLSSAGINQTLHRVLLCFSVSMAAVVGARDFEFETVAQSIICETVIVGKVPTVYVGGLDTDD